MHDSFLYIFVSYCPSVWKSTLIKNTKQNKTKGNNWTLIIKVNPKKMVKAFIKSMQLYTRLASHTKEYKELYRLLMAWHTKWLIPFIAGKDLTLGECENKERFVCLRKIGDLGLVKRKRRNWELWIFVIYFRNFRN